MWNGTVRWATPVDLARVHGGQIGSTDRTLTRRGALAGSTIAPAGAVLVSSRAPIGYVARSEVEIAFNQGCKAVVAGADLDPRFLQLVLMSKVEELKARGSGSTFLELSSDSLAATRIPAWPVGEQRRIAEFLDDRVARIDQIITARRRQGQLLRELGAAELDRIVTSAPFTLRPLQSLTDPGRPIRYGIVLPGPHVDGGVPIIKGGDIGSGRLERLELNRTSPEIEMAYIRSRVRPGDLVIAIRGSVGEIASVPDALDHANLTQDAARIAPHECDPDWLHAVLEAPQTQSAMARQITGATVRGINIGDLRRVPIPVPRRGGQAQIGLAARTLREESDAHARVLRVSSKLMTEYKQSLITAAVTGELDVTTAGSGIRG